MSLREAWRRSRQRRFCRAAASAVLYPSARIDNTLADPDAIRIGEHTHVRGQLLTFGHGGRIALGAYCYVGEDSRLWSAATIAVGDRVLISHNVNIFDNLTHPMSAGPGTSSSRPSSRAVSRPTLRWARSP